MSRETTLAVLLRQHTSIVVEVEAGGLGEALGILPGDRILQVQGWRVRASADIRRILDAIAGNGSLTVQVRRAGSYAILGPITLTELPSDPPPMSSPHASAAPPSVAQSSDTNGEFGERPADPNSATATSDTEVLLVTSESIPGHVVTEAKGIVTCVRAVPQRGVSAKARMESAVESAMQGLRQSAEAVGANAVIAVRVSRETDDSAAVQAIEHSQTVLVTGTAVVAIAASTLSI